MFPPVHVSLHPFGVAHDLPARRMQAKKGLQSLPEAAFLRPPDQAAIEHDPNADVPALQRNAPRPPTRAYDVIGRGRADAMTGHGPLGVSLRQFQSIPILDPAPSCPDGRG